MQVAINLSASHLSDASLPNSISNILSKTGLPAHCLEIEITENLLLEISDRTLKTLTAIKQLGVSIAIDDFGTGYSCLSYLRDLPIDTLKIDGSFIRHLGQESSNDGIVAAMIDMGHSLGLIIVAECVETAEQLAILKAMHCDIIQGFYYSKPLQESALIEYMLNSSAESVDTADS